MDHQTLVERFRSARVHHSLVVLEGFHPLKHAIRFGADLIEAVCLSTDDLVSLGAKFASDIAFDHLVRVVPQDVFKELAPVPPPTGVIAIAHRPTVSLAELLNNPAPAPVVLLENPRNLLNIGAAIRVSAAAGAAGVITTGAQDPWHPAAVIAGVGLQYALPVTRVAALPICDRPLVVVDPEGGPLKQVPTRAILAFGAERKGLGPELMASAGHRVSIPMSAGVSSLNIATSVAVVLYTWKFGG
ncbi:MAG: TrmH family RNA methyltransferase [Planctomycetota bacterium]|nr:TrmH family RNA methyltransferase [Planctomycetota bacterium]